MNHKDSKFILRYLSILYTSVCLSIYLTCLISAEEFMDTIYDCYEELAPTHLEREVQHQLAVSYLSMYIASYLILSFLLGRFI